MPVDKLPIKVLFMHGLESGPKGIKVQRLKKIVHEVHCPDMGVFLRKSSNPWVQGLVGLCAACLPVTAYSAHRIYKALALGDEQVTCWRPAATNLALSLVCCAAGFVYLSRRAVQHSLESCVKLQQAAIERYRPDVVVGSSFGAGIAAMMLAQRLYALPTLLLAPAQDKMCAKARLPLIERHEIEASGCSIEVVHGKDDEVIPVADSRRLYGELANCVVAEVDDVHHLNNYCLANNGEQLLRHIQSVMTTDTRDKSTRKA